MKVTEILYKKERYAIIGACFEVYNEKGCGFLEPVGLLVDVGQYRKLEQKPEFSTSRLINPKNGLRAGHLQRSPSMRADGARSPSTCGNGSNHLRDDF